MQDKVYNPRENEFSLVISMVKVLSRTKNAQGGLEGANLQEGTPTFNQ